MWGQVICFKLFVSCVRIIPMRVGTRYKNDIDKAFGEDHPHACGDKFVHDSLCADFCGSSPCVWGQVCHILLAGCPHRIIPMRVGTRSNTGNYNIPNKDHPHACGDKCSTPFYYQKDLRIIPMRVGTRFNDLSAKIDREDHPHACGDKTKEIKENSGFAKSTA